MCRWKRTIVVVKARITVTQDSERSTGPRAVLGVRVAMLAILEESSWWR
jgi:hypothetical protein